MKGDLLLMICSYDESNNHWHKNFHVPQYKSRQRFLSITHTLSLFLSLTFSLSLNSLFSISQSHTSLSLPFSILRSLLCRSSRPILLSVIVNHSTFFLARPNLVQTQFISASLLCSQLWRPTASVTGWLYDLFNFMPITWRKACPMYSIKNWKSWLQILHYSKQNVDKQLPGSKNDQKCRNFAWYGHTGGGHLSDSENVQFLHEAADWPTAFDETIDSLSKKVPKKFSLHGLGINF